MNTTRLILNNTYDFFQSKAENSIMLKNSQYNTFFLYFGLPNSPIPAINDSDDLSTSTSEVENETDSDKQTLSDM